MTIYEFTDLITDTENIEFSLFDCRTEDLIKVETYEDEKEHLNIDELSYSGYADYEILGVDMFIDKKTIHIEFNIETEEEE